MSHETQHPVLTRISDLTRKFSIKNSSRSRNSKFRFRSGPEPSHDDGVELQHLLSLLPSRTSEDPDGPAGIDNTWVSEPLSTSEVDLQDIISGTQGFDSGDWEATDIALTEPPPGRKVVKALETLIRNIDGQDHIPPRWSHVRPWLLSATRHTPCARPNTTNTNTSFTQLEVPPAVRRYLAASRHGSWDDETRKAARVVRTWVGYDVIRKSVMEVDAAKKAKDTDDVWHSLWAV